MHLLVRHDHVHVVHTSKTMVGKTVASTAPKATVLIRILVGAVFLSEGIQKFLFPESLGVGRFAKIAIPAPPIMAPFVGVVEIAFGACVIAGFLTRVSAIPWLIDISVAIAARKVPMLWRRTFWAAAHEARTDICMPLGLVSLTMAGAEVELNGKELKLGAGDTIPAIKGVATGGAPVTPPATSITFLAVPTANNASCR